MFSKRSFASVLFTMIIITGLQARALGQSSSQQSKEVRLAAVRSEGAAVRWEAAIANAGATLTVVAPDGRAYRREFEAGATVSFSLFDKSGSALGDGSYTYELTFTPVLSQDVKDRLAAARAKGDDAAVVQSLRSSGQLPGTMVQSGSFSVLNGAVYVGDETEPSRTATPKPTGKNIQQPDLKQRAAITPETLFTDDLIVQGSVCAGVDCVNGENFGFDTIRVKENNTRIQFDDTSTSAGFPTNNWQIRANSSASGGSSFLAFVDQGATGTSETGTIVFEVDAGAPANSLKVASNGKVGLRTATPVLDLHIATGDTPASRLEQTNASGFSAQTWDIAGNEANFFIRDVTSGSRLPFRIRPGAPTSSIDIAASGNVGFGTQTPLTRLHSNLSSSNTSIGAIDAPDVGLFITNSNTSANNLSVISFGNAFPAGQAQIGTVNLGPGVTAGGHLFFTTRTTGGGLFERLRITSAGNVGIGTTAPTDLLSVNGTASKPGGGSWDVFSDERLKNIKGRFNSGLKAVMQLQPLRYEYKRDNALGLKSEGEHVGFGAQQLQKVIPEAVSRGENGYLMVNNDPILWTMLNAIKEQQQEIQQLKKQIRQLQTASRKRRK